MSEMVLQICALYQTLPDYRTLPFSEIVFFYEGIRGQLHGLTKPK